MLTKVDETFLQAMIDMGKAIGRNDTTAAPAIIAAVNGLDLTVDERNMVSDTVFIDCMADGFCGSGAYLAFVDGLDCITDKDYRRKVLAASEAVRSCDEGKMRAALAEALSRETLLDDSVNDRSYISILLRLCVCTKDYDAMDVLRGKLVG